MNLNEVLENLEAEIIQHDHINFSSPIFGVCDNSNDVKEHCVFVAIEGFHIDGHNHIKEAISNGAAVIIGEKPIPSPTFPYIQVKNSRKVLGQIAANFYQYPSHNKTIIGITGTNGKTTTSYMLKHLFESFGMSCALIGTIENIINGKVFSSSNTTPNSLTLHRLLAESQDDIVIMEVSSHGLSQHRVEGISFDYCLFTNLDHEHLDYHASIEDYFATKLKLFDHLKPNGQAIINGDDPFGKKAKNLLQKKGTPVLTFGRSEINHWRIHQMNIEQSTFSFYENNQRYELSCPLPGKHNMYNLMMAMLTASLSGVQIQKMNDFITDFKGVKGRFEIFKNVNGATIIVDYAHTKEAIEHCLHVARHYGAKRIIHIFGFRGNRDPSKRRDMIYTTRLLSDQYILTFDDLNSITKSEMVETLQDLQRKYGNEKGRILPNRTQAIQTAILNSRPNDWIIITGKGHETYQQTFFLNTKNDKETVLHSIQHQKQMIERKI